MGYSPFKMTPKSPLTKALKGNQHKLPQHLQEAIKAAPESPAKQTTYGEIMHQKSLKDKEMGKRTKVIDKFISVLLTSGERPNTDALRLKNPSDFEKYYNQLDQTLEFIKSMN